MNLRVPKYFLYHIHAGFFIICFLGLTDLVAQDINQSVRGVVIDDLTLQPIEGMLVTLSAPDTSYSAVTNKGGLFVLNEVPVGRYTLLARAVHYKHFTSELLVGAGHSLELSIKLKSRDIELDSSVVVIRKPFLTDLNVLNTFTITTEQSKRIAASFFDPARVVDVLPGVVGQNDQNNNIIINGNPPGGVKWMLEGVNILNPNHLSNAGTLSDRPTQSGGGVNILSAQMLDNSQFILPPYRSYYGGAASGIFNMSLREGSMSKRAHTIQTSVLGVDLATEGPIGEKTSYLANVRYSTVGILSAMGLSFGGERINFYDGALSVAHKFENGAKLKVFAYFGNSLNEFEGSEDRTEWLVDKDSTNVDFNSQNRGVGFRINVPISKGNIDFSTAYSENEIVREVTPVEDMNIHQSYSLDKSMYSMRLNLKRNLLTGVNMDLGVIVDLTQVDISAFEMPFSTTTSAEVLINGNETYAEVKPYFNLNASVGKFSFDVGLRGEKFELNDEFLIGPHLLAKYELNGSTDITAGFRSSFQLPSDELIYSNANQGVDLRFSPVRVSHSFLGSRHILNKYLLSTSLFLNYYTMLPVFGNDSEFNRLNEFVRQPISGTGDAITYGLNLQIQRPFLNDYYLISGLSLFTSRYESGGQWYDSRFDSDYTLSLAGGKEIYKDKGQSQRVFAIDTKFIFAGGQRESVVNADASRDALRTVFDSSAPYNTKLNDYTRWDLRVSWRKEKKGKTRTVAIDIQNLLSLNNEAYSSYDFRKGRVEKIKQLGIIPVLVYRIDF